MDHRERKSLKHVWHLLLPINNCIRQWPCAEMNHKSLHHSQIKSIGPLGQPNERIFKSVTPHPTTAPNSLFYIHVAKFYAAPMQFKEMNL